MKKVNPVMYQRLLLQAQEAKNQGLVKVATAVLDAIGPLPEDEETSYDMESLNSDVYDGMWKLAMNVFKYHDINAANVEKVHEAIERLACDFINELESSVGVKPGTLGPLEPKLPGEFEEVDI